MFFSIGKLGILFWFVTIGNQYFCDFQVISKLLGKEFDLSVSSKRILYIFPAIQDKQDLKVI